MFFAAGNYEDYDFVEGANNPVVDKRYYRKSLVGIEPISIKTDHY